MAGAVVRRLKFRGEEAGSVVGRGRQGEDI